MKPRTSSYIKNKIEIPIAAMLHTDESGREFYISAQSSTQQLCKIRYTDNGDFKNVPTGSLQKEIEKQRNAVDAYWNNKNN